MSNAPTHDLCIVTGEGKTANWTRICAAWPTKDGEGFSGDIPASITITGRFVIQKRRGNDQQGG